MFDKTDFDKLILVFIPVLTTALIVIGCSNSANSKNDALSTAHIVPIVEAEENVYAFKDAQNGSGPTWCNGSTEIVHIGDDVFVSAFEVIDGRKPYNNVRWALYKRDSTGWQRVQSDKEHFTREPSPLACFPNQKKILLSGNPAIGRLSDEQLEQYGITTIAFLETSPVIDGNVGKEWMNVPAVSRVMYGYEQTHRVSFKSAIDSNNLYIAATIANPSSPTNEYNDPGELWNGDSIELYISGGSRHEHWSDADYVIHIPLTYRSGAQAAVFQNSQGKVAFAPSIRFALQKWDNGRGYDVEVRIPLDTVKLPGLRIGEKISFDWDVCFSRNGALWDKVCRNDVLGNAIPASPQWWGIAKVMGANLPVDHKWRWFGGTGNINEMTPENGSIPEGGPAQPEILMFSSNRPDQPYSGEVPPWTAGASFNEHTYRGIAADGVNNELLLLYQAPYGKAQLWTFRDRSGTWSKQGTLPFLTYDYESKPTTVRSLYPAIVLKDRFAAVVGNSGTIEPYKAWNDYRRSIGQTFLYVRRQLFYAWTPDIAKKPFTEWNELVNLDSTAGTVMQNDICITEDGLVHILWHQVSCDIALRDKFFPTTPITQSLHHGIVKDGKLISNDILAIGGEGIGDWVPTWSRFHQTPDGRLFVIYDWTKSGQTDESKQVENRIMGIFSDGGHSKPVVVPLKCPIGFRFTAANTRFGCKPSNVLDLIGYSQCEKNVMRYVRIRLDSKK